MDEHFLNESMRELFDLDSLASLATSGLAVSANSSTIIDQVKRLGSAGMLSRIDEPQTKRVEVYAKNQLASGFPALFELLIVMTQTILDTAVERLALEALEAGKLDLDSQQATKASLSVAAAYGDRDRLAEQAIRALMDSCGAAKRTGVNRYEEMLKPFGLDGQVPAGIKDGIHDLVQCRNLIVHKRGVADEQFIKKCGYSGAARGEKISFSHDHFHYHSLSAIAYIQRLCARLAVNEKTEKDMMTMVAKYDQRAIEFRKSLYPQGGR